MPTIKTLFADHILFYRETAVQPLLAGWQPAGKHTAADSVHLLYVCSETDRPNWESFAAGCSVLYVSSGQDAALSHTKNLSHLNLLAIKDLDELRVRKMLSDFFLTQAVGGSLSAGILDILVHMDHVQDIVNYAYPAFENPIFVFDAGFNLIAANWEEGEKIAAGVSIIANKMFSENEYEMANSRNHIHKKVLESERPVRSYNPAIGYDQLLCALDTRKDMGHIVVTAINRPLTACDAENLLILKKGIFLLMTQNEFIRNTKGFNYEYFLRDLLDGKIAVKSAFLNRLSHVAHEFSDYMYCIVIDIARAADTVNAYHIRNLFETGYPACRTLMYHGQIIVILNKSSWEALSEQYLSTADEICRKNHLYGGISNCFQSIRHFPEYYKQALRAVELAANHNDHPGLFVYGNYYMEHLGSIFAQKESPLVFCHPKLKRLLDYDKQNHSNLSYTLYMYLTHERNISLTSADMGMHRNSLVYRLKQIFSLIGDRFDDYHERQYIILSYEMLNFEIGKEEGRMPDP